MGFQGYRRRLPSATRHDVAAAYLSYFVNRSATGGKHTSPFAPLSIDVMVLSDGGDDSSGGDVIGVRRGRRRRI